jgi:Fic family protein
MHEHFEAIHPFVDGSGHVGRLLITLFLLERGRLSEPMFYLSACLERHRSDYYDLLQGIRTHGEWLPWLRFFLAGVEETARDVTRQVIASVELRESYRERLQGKRRALALLDALFDNPYVTVARAEKLLGVSNPTARQAVADLQRAGLLREITGRTWGKTYLAEPIMKIIDPEED